MFLRNLKWNFIVPIVFYSSMALAHFDLSAGLQGRTFPALGLLAIVDSGYNWVIWDERTGQNDKWKFGLKGFVFFSIFQRENIIPSEKQKNFGEYTLM